MDTNMAQIVVRNLDDAVVDRLKARAEQNNRSLEAEVRHILGQAAEQLSWTEAWERLDAFRQEMIGSGRTFGDSTDLIREDRDRH